MPAPLADKATGSAHRDLDQPIPSRKSIPNDYERENYKD